MEAIIHIGLPKTGTSSIQHYCSHHESVLANANVVFAKTGRILWFKDRKRHSGLRFACEPLNAPATSLMKKYGLERAGPRRRYTKRFFAKLDREIASIDDATTLFFSAEELSGVTHPGTVAKVKSEFEKRFSRVRVFCLLREPFDLLSSGYVQYIKLGGTEPWDIYLERRLQKDLFWSRIRLWAEAFGRENMHVRVMGQDALQPFGELLGLSLQSQPDERRNKSLSALGIEVLRDLNMTYHAAGQKRPSEVRSAFQRFMTGPSWRAPVEDSEAIYARTKAEREMIAENFQLTEADIAAIDEHWNLEAVKAKYAVPGDVLRDGRAGLVALLKEKLR